MSESYVIDYTIQLDISPETSRVIRQANLALYRTIGLLRRLGLPEDINSAMMMMQRAIGIANSLSAAMTALQVASGPWGWLLAGASFATSMIMAGDFAVEVMSR